MLPRPDENQLDLELYISAGFYIFLFLSDTYLVNRFVLMWEVVYSRPKKF